MKKSIKSLSIILSSLLVTGGAVLFGGSVISEESAQVSNVYAVDVDGDGIDDGEISTSDEDDSYFNYEGELDLYTGRPITEVEAEKSGTVTVSTGTYYDMDSHMFKYIVTGGSLSCSVCDGFITTGAVTFAASGEFNVSLYKNGEKMNGFPQTVSEVGSYTVITWDDNSENQLMSFQIVSKKTGQLSQYVVPDGFSVDTVFINGIEQGKSFDMVEMSTDGYYEIKYICNATNIAYDLDITIDHIPPQVTFEGVDKDDKARGPVTVKGLQSSDTVLVIRDEVQVALEENNQLTESGTYDVIVYDDAGNITEKHFRILLYLNAKSIVLFIMMIAILVGIFVALYITRKKLRVR